MIAAHGGRLIHRVATGEQRETLLARAGQATKLALNAREVSDLEMIGVGAMSPLEGFMGSDDLSSVVSRCRLANGVIWPLPVTLSAKGPAHYQRGQDLALTDEAGHLLGLIEVSEVYAFDKNLEAQGCLGTTDKTHPGVQYLDSIGSQYVAGPVWVLNLPHYDFANEHRSRRARRACCSRPRAGTASWPSRRATRSTVRTST
jgi:sulfate adenylyltransferase